MPEDHRKQAAVQAVVRHALQRGLISGEQLREALVIQQHLVATKAPADLLGILRARALRAEHLPELTRVYQSVVSDSDPANDSRPTGHGYAPLPEEAAIPRRVLEDSQELLTRPAEQDPEPVKAFLRASSEDATLRDSLASTRSSANEMPTQIGEFRVEGELARGAFGIVYRGHSLRLDRPVAIKVLRDSDIVTDEEIERFQIEARAAARLRHPNIVGIHYVGRDQGRHYLVMDMIEGETLKARIARDGRLQETTAAELVERLSDALHYAHSHQILHRDLKPSNVLISEDGQPLITDFGLAEDVSGADRGLTLTGDVMGTPAYMPPEQAEGDTNRIDRRADLYSLGATLYEMLTGKSAFSGPTALAIMESVVNDDPPPPRSICPGLSRDLETICLKCLEKDPEDRYDSAEHLAADLRRYLNGEPILARSLSPFGHAWRWVQRNRVLAGASALVTLLVLGGTSSFVLWKAAVEQERRAQAAQRQQSLRDEVVALLDSVEGNQKRSAEDVRRAYYALIRHTDPLAVEVMVARLDRVSAAFRAVVRNTYLEASQLTEEEQVSGHGGLEQLPAAVETLLDLTPGDALDEDAAQILARAQRVIEGRETARFQSDTVNRRADLRALLASRQGALADQVAISRVLTHALGQIKHPDVIECLGRYLAAERDPTRAIAAGQSLSRLGGERAQRLLLWTRGIYGEDSFYWRSVKRGLESIDESVAQGMGSGSEHVDRAEVHLENRKYGACVESASKALTLDPKNAVALTLRARGHYGLKDYERAREDAEQAVLANRTLAVAWAYLGLAREKLEDEAGAEAAYAKGLDAAPSDARLWRLRAVFRKNNRQWKAALKDANRAIALDDKDERNWGARGSVQHAQRNFQEAEQDYERAVALNGQSHTVWLNLATTRWAMGKLEQAEADAARALELAQGNDDDVAGVLTNRAVFHQARGNYEAALRDLDQAITKAPKKAGAWATRGAIRGILGRTQEGVADLNQALDLDPGLAEAWLNRGLFRAKGGDDAGGLSDIAEALRRDPALTHAYAQRATLRLTMGDHKGAQEDLETAARLSPRDPITWLSNGLFHAIQGDQKKAIHYYSRGLALDPKHLNLLEKRADAYLELGDGERALADCSRALLVAPRNVVMLERRAKLLATLDRLEESLADYDALLLVIPRNSMAWLARAAIRHHLGNVDGANEDVTKAIRLAPRDPELWKNRAVLESSWNRHGAALNSMGRAMKLANGKNPSLWSMRGQLRQRAGDPKSAMKDYEHFLRLVPSGREAELVRTLLNKLRRP